MQLTSERNLIATEVPLSLPLYTSPKPPEPKRFDSHRLLVEARMSSSLNVKRKPSSVEMKSQT